MKFHIENDELKPLPRARLSRWAQLRFYFKLNIMWWKQQWSKMSFRTSVLSGAALLLVLGIVLTQIPQSGYLNQLVSNKKDGDSPKTESLNLVAALQDQSSIKKFSSYDEANDYLKNNTQGNGGGYGMGGGIRNMATDSIMMKESAAPAAPVADMTAPEATPGENVLPSPVTPEAGTPELDYSKTNIQVENVDESDLMKIDGEFLYSVTYNSVFISRVYPVTDAKVVGEIRLENKPDKIFLNGDKLLVYGYVSQPNTVYPMDTIQAGGAQAKMMPYRPYQNFSFVNVYNISNKEKPELIQELKIEGSVIDSRMIGDFVYIVDQKSVYGVDPGPYPFPVIMEGGKEMVTDSSQPRCNCPDVYYFGIPQPVNNITSVHAINIQNPTEKIEASSYFMSYTQSIYVSEKNIYITYPSYINESQLEAEGMRAVIYAKLSSAEQSRIQKIENADEDILSKDEKTSKILNILYTYLAKLSPQDQEALNKQIENYVRQQYPDLASKFERTIIHKLAIDGAKVTPVAQGEVTGQVLNQFSMNEKDGNFVIATTKNQSWSRFVEESQKVSSNNLYILDEKLAPLGKLEGLAPGERLYSARFIGNRAYLVTFQQIDPLFAIDISNPAQPVVLGELKVPGFSQYLHPYNENLLIGFGKDTEILPDGRVQAKGLKMSLFDVSDVNNLKEINSINLTGKGGDSTALYDHKAFLFSAKKNLLVVPATEYDYSLERGYGTMVLNGAVVLSVDETGFKKRGEITHVSDSDKQKDPWSYNSWDNSILRSFYIENTLYTLSNTHVKASNLESLEIEKDIVFDPYKPEVQPVPVPYLEKDVQTSDATIENVVPGNTGSAPSAGVESSPAAAPQQ